MTLSLWKIPTSKITGMCSQFKWCKRTSMKYSLYSTRRSTTKETRWTREPTSRYRYSTHLISKLSESCTVARRTLKAKVCSSPRSSQQREARPSRTSTNLSTTSISWSASTTRRWRGSMSLHSLTSSTCADHSIKSAQPVLARFLVLSKLWSKVLIQDKNQSLTMWS